MRRQRILSALCLFLLAAPAAAAEWAPIGPDGGDVRHLATSPALPGWIFAGLQHFGEGLYRSADRGRSWEAAAGFQGLPVLDLAISADGRAVFAATTGGLLRSTDRGATWEPTGPADGEPSRTCILVQTHPRRPGLVLAAREDGALFRSTDQGATWTTRPEWPEDVRTLVFAPGSDVVYAGSSRTRIWKSTDAGQTWKPSSQGLPVDIRVQTLAIDPGNPRILYAGLLQPRRALYKSTDGGATWRPSQRGLAVDGKPVQPVLDLAVDLRAPSTVYAIVGDSLFRSLNSGRDWERLARPPGHFANDLEATPYGLLAATPGGVYLSTDRGLTWQGRNTGLTATSIFAMDLDTQDPPRLYATDHWDGIFRTARRGRPWLRLADVDERFVGPRPVRVDPEEPQTLYTGTFGGVAKSTDGGRSWTVHGELGCLTPTEIVLDPREPAHLYASGGVCGPVIRACVVVRSLDAGATWECVRGLPDPVDSKVLQVDPFTSALYILTGSGEIWKSADQGATWSLLFNVILPVRSFAASPLVEGTLWAGLPDGMVFRSRDGGQTWSLLGTGLPADAPVVALTPDPVDPGTLYAATREDGVFRSTDAGETWTPAGTWPAGIRFQGDLLVDPADRSILYAGTDGLGVLRLDQEN